MNAPNRQLVTRDDAEFIRGVLDTVYDELAASDRPLSPEELDILCSVSSDRLRMSAVLEDGPGAHLVVPVMVALQDRGLVDQHGYSEHFGHRWSMWLRTPYGDRVAATAHRRPDAPGPSPMLESRAAAPRPQPSLWRRIVARIGFALAPSAGGVP